CKSNGNPLIGCPVEHQDLQVPAQTTDNGRARQPGKTHVSREACGHLVVDGKAAATSRRDRHQPRLAKADTRATFRVGKHVFQVDCRTPGPTHAP
ncbi:MAG: hypothetical protein GY832_03695, partial [Chloroflexi bacterium]|nr:hypothetical protein [Chloroflexota bacterium]